MKFINLEYAKKVAMTGLAMTSCGFLLWVSQGTSHADEVTSAPTTSQTPVTNQTQSTSNDSQSQQPAEETTPASPTATATTQVQVAANQAYNRNDNGNYAYMDNATLNSNGNLQVSGWHATNQASNKPYHYVILLDQTAGHEVTRQLVHNGTNRPDVAKAYPRVKGADKSGFNVAFSLNKVNFNHKLQLLSRYSASRDGNSNYVDYYFAPITKGSNVNQGNLDNFTISDGQHLNVAGWHANDVSKFENQRFIIIYDNTANRQIASQKVNNVSRPDVAKVYPTVATAGQSGFAAFFDINRVPLVSGHSYSVVSRYSTSANGNGGNGQYTDFWSAPVSYKGQQAFSLDQVKMTNQGLQIAGWMASDSSKNRNNAYAIVLNNGVEVARQKLNLTNRPDVARVYPLMFNSANSGFNTVIRFNPAAITGNMQVLLRFTNDPAGNGNSVDQRSQQYASNQGKFDNISVNGASVYVSGWHASDQAVNKPYQYLIFLNASGKEVYRQRVLDVNRANSTAAAAAPYILNSANSGYRLGLTLPASAQGQVIRVIHRFTDDINGNGNAVDLYSDPLVQYNMTANTINRYILQNKIGHANIQTNYVIPEVTGTYSQTSNGRPDMVVVHETANPNDSIAGEINFERTHYNNAFVHAFVDGNNIVEISNTDREAWGAGYPANGRAIQFEQVEVYGAGNFVRELVNGAYYTAYKMKQYGIVPTLAWYNHQTGQYGGTLWSHHMVSQYMHVTDHTDPDGYWANRASQYFGTSYTMGDFFELVKYEYRQL